MTERYRGDVILARAPLRNGELERLNQALAEAGLGRPLRAPTQAAGGHPVTVLPLAGADPVAVRDAVSRARGRGERLPELVLDIQYAAGTVDDPARRHDELYHASGKKIGHGTIGWLSAPAYEMGDPPPWRRPAGQRGVIALLDTEVEEHPWLPDPDPADPFVIEAPGWLPPVPLSGQPPDRCGGTHHGHGTFLAGLIRSTAPDARILSVPVMTDRGQVSEANVIAALEWVAGYLDSGGVVDVVLIAFGRSAEPGGQTRSGQRTEPAEPGDGDLGKVEDAIRTLSRAGVTLVASAGNGGSETPVWPAAFATYPDLSVVSVGARSTATTRAPYSNYGVWVRHWREGTNVVSLMPVLTKPAPAELRTADCGYAWWSGTSFAAARYAAELAAEAGRLTA